MARQEHPREDLLRGATALVERAELRVAGDAAPVVIGFRAVGAVSLFFDQDPVYHFTSNGSLRRAFVGGLLYKAEHGRLASLLRQREAHAVALVRHDLSGEAQQRFLAAARDRLRNLSAMLDAGRYEVVGQSPAGTPIVERAKVWLAALPATLAVAESPRVE